MNIKLTFVTDQMCNHCQCFVLLFTFVKKSRRMCVCVDLDMLAVVLRHFGLDVSVSGWNGLMPVLHEDTVSITVFESILIYVCVTPAMTHRSHNTVFGPT